MIIKLICRNMNIQYENTTTCMQCWGGHANQRPQHYQNQIYYIDQHQYPSNKATKMSLKKHKIGQKQPLFPSYPVSQQATHQKLILSPSVPYQPYFVQRPLSHMNQQRPKNLISQNNEIKVTFNRQSYQQKASNKYFTVIPKLHFEKRQHVSLDQTAKIGKGHDLNRSQLYETKKMIPGSRFSLQELSNMKESVQSICQGEEKPKIQESTIMMDYFNPTTSRLADLKLKSKTQQFSSICSQRL